MGNGRKMERRCKIDGFVIERVMERIIIKREKNVMFIKERRKLLTRTVISGGKRPNPSDLGS